MTTPVSRPAWLAAVAAACGLVVGCGSGDDLERVSVAGSVVTAEGTASNGSITLRPVDEMLGPATTTAIVDGRFRFDDTNGPVAGEYEAVVRVQPAGGKLAAVKAGDAEKTFPQQWTFPLTVPPEGVREHRFDLGGRNP